ncbi:MAG: hypothetical protein ACP5J4_07600 [Anaerolineae bacterium]
MKAAIVERPGVLTVKEIPMPEVGEYDALCDLLYGATCTGTDQHLIAGRFPWPGQYPTIWGHASVWLDLAHPFALDDIGAAFEAVRARTMVKAVVRLTSTD